MKKKLALIALIGSLTGVCCAEEPQSTNDSVLAGCPCKDKGKKTADVTPPPPPAPSNVM